MVQINTFPYRDLTNGNMSRLCELLSANYMQLPQKMTTMDATPARSVIMSIVFPRIKTFDELAQEFINNVRQSVSSGYTTVADSFERERDRDINMGFRLVTNALKSNNAEVAGSAVHVDAAWRLYGDLVNRQRNEQTQMTSKLVRDMRSPELFVHVQKIPMLEAALEAIEKSNNAFAENIESRTSQRDEIVPGLTQETREKLDVAAIDLVRAINIVAATFADYENLNEIIHTTNTILSEARLDLSARRRGRALSKSSLPNPSEEGASEHEDSDDEE